MTTKSLGVLVKKSFASFVDDNAMRLAASLAFYTIWSIGPLLLIVTSVAGLVWGREAAQGYVVGALHGLIGDDGARELQETIVHAYRSGHSVLANAVGVVTLLIAASGVIAELKSSLDEVWDVTPKPGSFLSTLKRRFFSLTMVLAMSFLLLVSLLFNAALSAAGKQLHEHVPGGAALAHVIHVIVSFALTTALFCTIFKVVPDARIRWRDVLAGGLVTSALFTLGQVLIGVYVGNTSISSAYGAASSLMIILVWIFFSSCILFFGAEFTRVYADMYGEAIEPGPQALEKLHPGPRNESENAVPKARALGAPHVSDQRPSDRVKT